MDTQDWKVGDRFYLPERPGVIYTAERFYRSPARGGAVCVNGYYLNAGQGIGIDMPIAALTRLPSAT